MTAFPDTGDIPEPVCRGCIYLAAWPRCFAFPDGIPDDIRAGRNRHSSPIDGDNGLQFEAVGEASKGGA